MVSSNHYKNENLIKLKELSDKICETELSSGEDNSYKEVVDEITKLVENSDDEIQVHKTKDHKLKCYEGMCLELKKILTKIKTTIT
jgi:hypothetical protein